MRGRDISREPKPRLGEQRTAIIATNPFGFCWWVRAVGHQRIASEVDIASNETIRTDRSSGGGVRRAGQQKCSVVADNVKIWVPCETGPRMRRKGTTIAATPLLPRDMLSRNTLPRDYRCRYRGAGGRRYQRRATVWPMEKTKKAQNEAKIRFSSAAWQALRAGFS